MVLDATWYELFLKTNTGDNWKFDWEEEGSIGKKRLDRSDFWNLDGSEFGKALFMTSVRMIDLYYLASVPVLQYFREF